MPSLPHCNRVPSCPVPEANDKKWPLALIQRAQTAIYSVASKYSAGNPGACPPTQCLHIVDIVKTQFAQPVAELPHRQPQRLGRARLVAAWSRKACCSCAAGCDCAAR